MSFSATWRRTGAVCSESKTRPMPPSPSRRITRYRPRNSGRGSARRAGPAAASEDARALAATCKAGVVRNSSVPADAARSERTSRQRDGSPSHACVTNCSRALCSISSAAWKIDSIFCQFSGSTRKPLTKFAAEPTFCETPVTVNGFFGDLQNVGDFHDRQTAEEPQFDDLALARVDESEPFQSVVDSDEVRAGPYGYA